MIDVMVEEANLWFQEAPRREPKLEALVVSPPLVEEEDIYLSSDEEVDLVAEEKYRQQVVESCGFDVDFFFPTYGGIFPGGCSNYDLIFAKVGLHCYNIEKGKNLQLKSVLKVNAEAISLYNSYSTSQVIDPVDNSLHIFQAHVNDPGNKNNAGLVIRTKICRIKPQVPGLGDATTIWNFDAIDKFYKGNLPDWPPGDKLHLYEVKESELRDNDWLYLYAEVALFSKWQCNEMSDHTPFEMKKVVVQTQEDVESSMMLKSSNAIFYMTFKTRGGTDCRGIIRKTSDGITGHLSLEARCWTDN
ncbi:hypothetical protein AALP_AA4G189500 [Arabis alpina]|uniref:Uncharacterized protein n=1 Tax=Arabis alpina TaxID=50452 RepID=A0A087H465_ARAAL|nr:hypothetical protein AALP_AA4G189500 [Arabis alpina]